MSNAEEYEYNSDLHKHWCPSRKGGQCICSPADEDCQPGDHRCVDDAIDQEYLVEWSIHIVAKSAEDAARIALSIQRDPANVATVFEVTNTESGGTVVVDLLEGD